MSHVYIYSPSSAVGDKAAFRRGVARLKALGHEVEVDESALRTHMRFAGSDEERLAAIHRAAASGADAALISRGGYGLTRILAGIEYRKIDRSIERGTRFIGLSDFTALQCALLAKTGATTWAGSSVGDFGTDGPPDEVTEACFQDLLAGRGEGAGWRLPVDAAISLVAATRGKRAAKAFDSGKATLWGGNLAVLCALLATPWFPQVKGGVLFLEDVNEHPYRVERMLTQLLHAGVLQRQKALVLGHFTNYKPAPHDRGFSLKVVVERLRGLLRIPIFTGLPFGHVPTKVLLPVGARVRLVAEDRDALIFWGHSG